MDKVLEKTINKDWNIPNFDISFFSGVKNNACVVIPVINEGERISSLLKQMFQLKIHEKADIIIIDGGSTDGSLDRKKLETFQVTGLLVKTGEGKLSAQLRCAYSFALCKGYKSLVTIDGNNKDEPDAIVDFIEKIDDGWDFVQGSRYVKGGKEINTPFLRTIAIRLIHAPLLSIFSGFKWTDTTQGFRAYSRQLLLDTDVAPFREVFKNYELLAYLSYRAPKLSFRCCEVPTTRIYPKGKVPTKISAFSGNLELLRTLFATILGRYNP